MGFGQDVVPEQTEAVARLGAHTDGGSCKTYGLWALVRMWNLDRWKLLRDLEHIQMEAVVRLIAYGLWSVCGAWTDGSCCGT